jgi:adenylate cyclase
MKRQQRWVYLALCLGIIAAAVAIRIGDPFVVQALRLLAFDTYQKMAPRDYDPSLPVRVVDIDEESLRRLGQFPWPRTMWAELLDRLAAAGAVMVAIDATFPEPDRTSPEELARSLPPAEAAALQAAASGGPTHDEAFATAIGHLPTVLGAVLTNAAAEGVAPEAPKKAGFAVSGDDPRAFIRDFPAISDNLPVLADAALGIGAVNWVPDRDQVVRRVTLVFTVSGQYVPSLAAEALRVAQGASTYVLRGANTSGALRLGNTGLNAIRIGAADLQTDAEGAIWLQFRKTAPERFLPVWKILAGEVPQQEIAGNVLFIGSSAAGLQDLRASPLDTGIPGVEIQAQALEDMLTGKLLVRLDYADTVEIIAIILLGLLFTFLLNRLSALFSAALGILTIVGIFGACWIAFGQFHLLFDPLYPAGSLLLLLIAATLYVYRQSERQRAEVRTAFSRYVSPAVVDDIISDPSGLELGGEVRELTLLFCDVRNFTSISEQMTAHELTRFINQLLTPLSDVILRHRGTIDKYMGDAIMAFWNAPLDEPNHAVNACQSAVEMAAALIKLNEEWQAMPRERPFPTVRIGIGINTGECCVGNLGSEQRFDYSAIGDNVNVASRFEGLSKLYGLTTIIGERTAAALPSADTLELDLVRVKGRGEPTRIFTLLAVTRAGEPERAALQAGHASFLESYRSQKWDEAEAAIGRCLMSGVRGMEGYYAVFTERIAGMRANPPPLDWDGAFTSLEK